MAIPRKLPLESRVVFPYGAYMVGDIGPLRDYDRSTKDQMVQATDPDTGLLLWTVDVVDADPEATKSNRTMTVKIPAKVQPVIDRDTSAPFTAVEFIGLTCTPWVDSNGAFAKLAWSLRANEVSAAGPKTGSRTGEKAA